jgi:hypothetical protein
MGVLMFKILSILAGASCLALAVMAIGLRADRRTAAEVSHAVVAGVILGSGVWPYNSALGPTGLQPQPKLIPGSSDAAAAAAIDPRIVIPGSADCDGLLQCPRYRID